MENLVEFVTANWGQILVALLAVVGAASAIAKLTPNKTDDKIVGFIQKWLDKVALNPARK